MGCPFPDFFRAQAESPGQDLTPKERSFTANCLYLLWNGWRGSPRGSPVKTLEVPRVPSPRTSSPQLPRELLPTHSCFGYRRIVKPVTYIINKVHVTGLPSPQLP